MDISTIIGLIPEVLTAVVIVATAIAKITPTESDDKKVQEWTEKIHKILLYFPTIGKDKYVSKLEKLAVSENKKIENDKKA